MKLNILSKQILPLTFFEGDVKALIDNNTSTKTHAGWSDVAYPSTLIIDLLSQHKLDKIRYYDGSGNQSIKISAKKSLNENEKPQIIFSGATNLYNSWVDINLSSFTFNGQFILLELLTPKAEFIPEFEVYGTSLENASTLIPNEFKFNKVLEKNFFGINGFNWIPTNKHNFFPLYRSYHNMPWVANTSINELKFANGAGGAFNGDKLFSEYKSSGITTLLCIQGNPTWLINSVTGNDQRFKAHPYKAKSTDPSSYTDFCKVLFQYAARYGETKVEDSKLTLKTGITGGWDTQPRLSGLGTLKYMEIQNEPDKNWHTINGHYNPFEYAALLSAAWDGHENTIQGNVGIKNADPTMKIVLAGMYKMDWKYIKLMDLWFKANRKDKKFCADVINFHLVCNDGGEQFTGTKGISPEKFDMEKRVKTFVMDVKEILPNHPIILTEFGYDTNTSIQAPNDFPLTIKEEVQGGWLVRSFLNLANTGIDEAYIYYITDEDYSDSTKPYLYTMCGLTRPFVDGCKPKLGHTIVKNFISLIGDKKWDVEKKVTENLYKLTNINQTGETLEFHWGKTLSLSSGKTVYNLMDSGLTATVVNSDITLNLISEVPIAVYTIKKEDEIIEIPTEETISNLICGCNLKDTSKLKDFLIELEVLMLKYKVNAIDNVSWFKF